MIPWHGIIPPPPGYYDYNRSSLPINQGIYYNYIVKPMNKVEDYSFHPFDTANCKKRLVEEYETHCNLVVGFDFDNTVFDYHNNGGNYSAVIDLLKRCKDLGFTLCLSTSEFEQDKIDWKVKYCDHYGIKPDYINESPILKGTKKPFFSILLDDRAGLESAFYTLEHVVKYAEAKSMQQGEE